MHDFNIGGSEAPKPAANKPLQRDLTGFDGIDAVRFAPHVPIGSGTQPPRYHLESRISRHGAENEHRYPGRLAGMPYEEPHYPQSHHLAKADLLSENAGPPLTS